jgi:adenylate cyclase class IV
LPEPAELAREAIDELDGAIEELRAILEELGEDVEEMLRFSILTLRPLTAQRRAS